MISKLKTFLDRFDMGDCMLVPNNLSELLIFILFTVSCDVPKTYKVTGVVKDIEYTENKLLIDHEEIPGFMVKMVLPNINSFFQKKKVI